ncbi:MAG: hypothetical protein AAF665_00440 [Pseudomonadota bacterium]
MRFHKFIALSALAVAAMGMIAEAGLISDAVSVSAAHGVGAR